MERRRLVKSLFLLKSHAGFRSREHFLNPSHNHNKLKFGTVKDGICFYELN